MKLIQRITESEAYLTTLISWRKLKYKELRLFIINLNTIIRQLRLYIITKPKFKIRIKLIK